MSVPTWIDYAMLPVAAGAVVMQNWINCAAFWITFSHVTRETETGKVIIPSASVWLVWGMNDNYKGNLTK